MKKEWVFILLSMTAFTRSEQPKTSSANPDTVIYLNVENKQEANSSVIIPPPPKKMRCSECKSGIELKNCLQATTRKKRIALLKKLPKQDRSTYIKNLNRDEYEKFLSLFTEQTWHDLLANLSPSEQQQWPQNIKEQLDKLARIKKNGDDDYYKNVIKDTLVDLVFLPVPFAYGIIVSLDCHKNARNAIEKEEQEYKKYLEEKFS